MAEKKKGTSHRSDVPIILVRLALLICLRRCWTAARQDALAGLPAHEILHIHRRAGEDVINNSLDAQGAELRRDDRERSARRIQVDENLAAESGREQVGEQFPETRKGCRRPTEARQEHTHRRHEKERRYCLRP